MLTDPDRGAPATPPAAAGALGPTTGRSVLRGGLWAVAGRVVPPLQVLGLSIIAARYLGPDGMGRQSYIAFIALSLTLVATAGLPSALSRFAAVMLGRGAQGAVRTLYGWTWRIQAGLAAVAAAALAVAAALGADPGVAWLLAGLGSAAAVLQAIPAALLVAAQRWREATIVGLVTGTVALPAAAAVLAAGGGITGLFAVEAAVLVVNLAVTAAFGARLVLRLAPAAGAGAGERRPFLRFAGGTTVLVLIQFVVWQRSELLVLDRASTEAQIALYSIGFAAVAGLSRIPDAISKVATPVVATLVGAGAPERIRSGFWRAVRLLLLVGPAVTAGTAAAGPELIRLAYGPGYAGAGDVLLVLLAPLLLLPFATLATALLFGLGRLRFLVVAGIAASAVDIGLAVLLIPSLDALGAATANAVAQIVAGVPGLVLAGWLMRPVDLVGGEIARALAAALVCGAATAIPVAVLGGVAGVAVGVPAGLAAWTGALLVLRPLGTRDARWLADGIGGERAGRALARLAAPSGRACAGGPSSP